VATLTGGLAAGLAGANAQAGASAAENEVLNNSLSDKVEKIKKEVVAWAQWTYADPLGDIARWAGDFGRAVQANAKAKLSEPSWSLALQGTANGVNALFGLGGDLPPGSGFDPVLVGSGAGRASSSITTSTPPNATLASGNGSTDQSATNGTSDSSPTLPGMSRPLRAPNPDYAPNSTVVDAMNSSQVKAMVADTRCGDCSDIASYLYRAAGGEGQVIEVTPARPNNLNVYENGSLEAGQSYHQVYSDGQYVYDPRVSSAPIPKGDWMQLITKTNPSGISISVVKGAK
jgi:filamentous hemagglutinin